MQEYQIQYSCGNIRSENGEKGMSATSILLNVIFHSLMNHHMRAKFKIASCEGEFAFSWLRADKAVRQRFHAL